MKQGTANLAEDYCFIHKALRPVGTARRQIAAVPPSNSRAANRVRFINNVTIQSEDRINILHVLASTDKNHTLLVIKYHLMVTAYSSQTVIRARWPMLDGEKTIRSSAYIR